MVSPTDTAGPLDRQRPDVGSSSDLVALGCFVPSAFRNSRVCFRSRILRFRCRPNLALSPFLCDTVPSFVKLCLGGSQFDSVPFRKAFGVA